MVSAGKVVPLAWQAAGVPSDERVETWVIALVGFGINQQSPPKP